MIIVALWAALFVLSTLLLGQYRMLCLKWHLLDHPNQRSSHDSAVPRGGGIIFSTLWMITLLVFWTLDFIDSFVLLSFLPGAAVITAIGFYDDCCNASRRLRLIIQTLVAFGLWVLVWKTQQPWLAASSYHGLAWLVLPPMVIWSINLYNFMDGIDGIAGVQALFMLSVMALCFWLAGGQTIAVLAVCLLVTVGGFLVWNWPQAELFMGDVGSGFLGFVMVVFAIIGQIQYDIPVLVWLISYSLFLFDASVTLLRRIVAREQWYQPHQKHAFQRLYLAGWSHQRVLFGVIILNTLLSALAVAAYLNQQLWWPCSLIALGLLSMVYAWIERRQPMFASPVTSASTSTSTSADAC
jgi:Fuc2NAc and GlcNAc transferase